MVYIGSTSQEELLKSLWAPFSAAPVKCMGLSWPFLLHPDDLHGLPEGKLPIGAW